MVAWALAFRSVHRSIKLKFGANSATNPIMMDLKAPNLLLTRVCLMSIDLT